MSVRLMIAAWMFCAAVSTTTVRRLSRKASTRCRSPAGARAELHRRGRPVGHARRVVVPHRRANRAALPRAGARPLAPALEQFWSRSANVPPAVPAAGRRPRPGAAARRPADETVWNAESRIGLSSTGHVARVCASASAGRASRSSRTSSSTCSNASTACNCQLDALRRGSGTTLRRRRLRRRGAPPMRAGGRWQKEVRRTADAVSQ